jgi:hypothetical protein
MTEPRTWLATLDDQSVVAGVLAVAVRPWNVLMVR